MGVARKDDDGGRVDPCDEEDAASGAQIRRIRGMTSDSGHVG